MYARSLKQKKEKQKTKHITVAKQAVTKWFWAEMNGL